jgi:hypothetical protein
MIAAEYPVDITYPAGVPDGYVGQVSLGPVGMPDQSITLHFQVQEW